MRKRVFLLSILMIALFIVAPKLVLAEEYTSVSTADEFTGACSTGGSFILANDITLSANIAISTDLNLDLNGHVLDLGAKTLAPYKKFVIKDTSSEQKGRVKTTGSFIIQIGSSTNNENADFTLESGTLDGAKYGIRNFGSFTLKGGTVIGDQFIIYNQGSVILEDGTIYGTKGPGFRCNADSSVVMNGGIIQIDGNANAVNLSQAGATFVMNGGTIKAEENGGAGIALFVDTEFTMNGGEISANSIGIAGNGSGAGEANDGRNAKITINGGTVTATDGVGIYAPQRNGVTTITGGTISGPTGIELRAGTLNISGGTINGTSEEYSTSMNTSGSTTSGASVAVIQHTTKQPIDVNITGGTFTAKVPFAEDNSLGNSLADIAKINYDISGGVFNSTGTDTILVEDWENGPFISGGKFTHYVTDYVKEGYGEKPENNMIAVYKWRTVTLNQTEIGNSTITRNKTISDDGTTVVTEPDQTSDTSVQVLDNDEVYITFDSIEGYNVLSAIARIVNGDEIDALSGEFDAPDSDIELFISYAKIVSKEIDEDKKVETSEAGVKTNEETNEILVDSYKDDDDLAQLVADRDVVIELVIEETTITDAQKADILDLIGDKNAKIINSYDIYVVIKDKDGNELGRISVLNEDIDLVIKLADKYLKAPNGMKRTFYVIRDHEGLEALDNELNGKNIEFKSNKFSTYTIAYLDMEIEKEVISEETEKGGDVTEPTTEEAEETKETSNPNTDDLITYEVMMFGISALCFMIIRKRK